MDESSFSRNINSTQLDNVQAEVYQYLPVILSCLAQLCFSASVTRKHREQVQVSPQVLDAKSKFTSSHASVANCKSFLHLLYFCVLTIELHGICSFHEDDRNPFKESKSALQGLTAAVFNIVVLEFYHAET